MVKRVRRGPFKATILFWTVMNLVDSAVIIANDPAGYRFRGDTWGIDLNLATFRPVLKALLVPMQDITDRIGWTLTVVEWLLLNLAFLPWVPVEGARAPSISTRLAASSFL